MKVSIVIPCYNVESFIESCLDSAYGQDYSDIEVICVNDGSSDRTAEVLEDLKTRKFESLTVFNQANQGACSARNKGMELSDGEYIQFLDGDDILEPFKISEQVEILNKLDYEVDLIVCGGVWIEPNGQKNIQKVPNPKFGDWENLFSGTFGCTVSNLFRRSKIVEVGGWNVYQKSSQEYELMFRMLKKHARTFYHASENTQLRIMEGTSISRSNLRENLLRFLNLRLDIRDWCRQQNIPIKESKFRRITWDIILQIYKHDRDLAAELYDKHLGSSFKPDDSKINRILYSILGFTQAERLKSWLK